MKNRFYLLSAALLALTATASAEERIFWISIADGVNNQTTVQTRIAEAVAQNYNAICILTRYRADAFYIPNRDFDTYTNNEPRRTTSPSNTDIVQFAIDRGHESGLRVYAAWSCFLVTDGSSTYPSVLPANGRQWVYRDTDAVGAACQTSTYNPDSAPFPHTLSESSSGLWVDPAVPAVSSYTIEVLQDFVQNYDIDGIILDRVRYPDPSVCASTEELIAWGYNPDALAAMGLTNPAPGSTTFRNAKRDAVTDFINTSRDAVLAIKPWLIYGATPVVYGSSLSDTYSSVYQHFPSWNTSSNSYHVNGLGALDLIAPQYYRTTTATNDALMLLAKPDVTNMAHMATLQCILEGTDYTTMGEKSAINICDTRDVNNGTMGFGMFSAANASQAAYKAALAAEVTACGSNVLGSASPEHEFTNKIGWDNTAPAQISNLVADGTTPGIIQLSWTAPAGSPAKYLIYRSTTQPVKLYYANLLNKTTTVTGNTFSDTPLTGLAAGTYYYRVVPVDGYNNKSNSNEATGVASVPEVIVPSRTVAGTLNSPAYSESSPFSDSSSKSAAPGNFGTGSRFTTTTGRSATFRPSVPVSGNYDVYVTVDNAASHLANVDWSVTTQAGGNANGQDFGLDGTGGSSIADTWEKLNTTAIPFRSAAGGETGGVTLTYDLMAGDNRMNMDAVRFVLVSAQDYDPPTASGIMLSGVTSPTNANTVAFNIQFSEGVENFNAIADLTITATGVTYSGTSFQTINDSEYLVTFTGVDGTGSLSVSVSTTAGITDAAGNALASSVTGNVAIDNSAPTAVASSPATKVTGAVAVTAALNGTGSTIDSATLFARKQGGSWASAGDITSGSMNFSPVEGSGVYYFAVGATDAAGNALAAPTGSTGTGDDSTNYNTAQNGVFSQTIGDVTQSYLFPMTDSLNVVLNWSLGTVITGPITVSRTVGNVAPSGYNAGRLIDESIQIGGTFTGGTGTIVWNAASVAPSGTFSGTLNSAYRFQNGTNNLQQIFQSSAINPGSPTLAISGTQLTLSNVLAYSDLFAGDSNASTDWTILSE
jgi:uncharacterized lipoprotein YddW (UPF0748 family)